MPRIPRLLLKPGWAVPGAAIAVLAFLVFAMELPGTARAQEPSPTPTRTATPSPTATTTTPTASATPSGTPSPLTCAGSVTGGQTVTVVGTTTVRLPAGGRYDVTVAPAGAAEPSFTVCHAESLSRVTINSATCREMSESIPNASGALVIAQIVESCSTGGQVAGATAVPSQTGGISPPSTGDGGVR